MISIFIYIMYVLKNNPSRKADSRSRTQIISFL